MRILLIGNLSDRRCGFQNFCAQTITAFSRTSHELTAFDGTYSQVYARQQTGDPGFFPPDVLSYDVVHVVWHAMTLNHYAGADWASLAGGPVISWWDGGPSDASCPFKDCMQVRWSDYPRDGYHYSVYPVPDWVDILPYQPCDFTVGASTVRGDGVGHIKRVCEAHGWAMNLPEPEQWLSIEDEVRRLARSSVNVCWYDTPPLWHNRASAPSMLLAAKRPLLINEDLLVAHLWDVQEGIWHGWKKQHRGLDGLLDTVYAEWKAEDGNLERPVGIADRMSWSRACEHFVSVWQEALDGR